MQTTKKKPKTKRASNTKKREREFDRSLDYALGVYANAQVRR